MRQKELNELKAWRLALADAGDQHNAMLLGMAIETIVRGDSIRIMALHFLEPLPNVPEAVKVLKGDQLR